jgi:hypothetical protein
MAHAECALGARRLPRIRRVFAVQEAPPAPPPALCVVAPAAWQDTLKPFLDARGKELKVEFAALEDAVASESGADAPERLKRFLYRGWKERGLRYVLLAGDADVLPVRFMVLDRFTEAAANYAFYACDLYYADVADERGAFDDWNAQHDGFHARYFGEVRGESIKSSGINFDHVSYVPELALGRWPVSDANALARVVAKTLAWKPTGAKARALLVHADGWVDARPRVSSVATDLARAGFEVATQLYGADGVPSPQSVSAALAGGVDLAFHIGHGTATSWPGCLGPAECAALVDAHPAICMSIGCNTAEFCTEPPYCAYLDESGLPHRGTYAGEVFREAPPPPACLQPALYNASGIGEELVRAASGGAVVYIGCNTGAQPCALTLFEGFAEALAAGTSPRVGDAWRAALAHYWSAEKLATLAPNDDWYPPSVFFQGMKFMYFGDPTLALAPQK